MHPMPEPLISSEPSDIRPPRERLARMLVISLAVHLVIFSAVLLSPQGGGDSRTVAFVDLTMPAAGPPAAPNAPPQPVPKPPSLAEHGEKTATDTDEPPAKEPEAVTEPAKIQPVATGGTSISLGIGRGYFGSLGEGATLRDEIREYYFEMVKLINDTWWQRPEADDSRVGMVMVMIVVARDGKVVNCQLMRGSGRQQYDQAVLAAVQAASPLPPLPAAFDGDFFQAPLRVMPPLSLMRIGEGLKGVGLR